MTTALALAFPSLVAAAAYGAAALLKEQRTTALRAALVVGWLAHALAIGFDIAEIGRAHV